MNEYGFPKEEDPAKKTGREGEVKKGSRARKQILMAAKRREF